MGAVQLVGPVGDHDEQAIQGLLVPDQEGQQIPGRAVGPVRVLDDHDDRACVSQLFEQDEYLLEQPGPGFTRVPGPGRLTELREQPASSRVPPPGSSAATPSVPRSRTSSRSIVVNGANGSPSTPSSRQPRPAPGPPGRGPAGRTRHQA